MQVVSPKVRFAYTEDDSPTHLESVRLFVYYYCTILRVYRYFISLCTCQNKHLGELSSSLFGRIVFGAYERLVTTVYFVNKDEMTVDNII